MANNVFTHDRLEKGNIILEEHLHDHNLHHVSTAEVEHLAELTPEQRIVEKRLVRLIDFRILPLVILVYLMNYIDRNNYAAAKLQGLEKDLKLVGNDYQTGLSILFVGYVLMQVPSNALLNFSGRPSWYLGFFIILWGLVSALTSQAKSYTGIVLCRFFLGLVEAPFFAGVLFYLSKWYTKSELSFRMAVFYSGSLISGAFGSLLAAAILAGLVGKRGLDAWQWLFIIEGTLTMFLGVCVTLFLPDFPDTWSSLSPEMKNVANRRLAIDAAVADVDESGAMSQFEGVKLAVRDPKTWLFAIMYHAIAAAGGFQYFFPTLTSTLGYSHTISLLLVAPPYIFMVGYSLLHSMLSDKMQNRFWFWIYPQPIVIVGFLLFMFTKSFAARYFSFFLMVFIFALNGTLYAWISDALPRPPAKRAASYAIINSVANTASIWTPYTYATKEAPHYVEPMAINIGMLVLSMICAVILHFYTRKQNKELDRQEAADLELDEQEVARLKKTAEFEGVDLSAARVMQKKHRYMY